MVISRVQKNGVPQWRVSYQVGGIQHRRFFRSEEAADKFAKAAQKDAKQLGEGWLQLSISQRQDAMMALERAFEHGYRLVDACDFYEKANRSSRSKSQNVALFTQECLESKLFQGLRPASLAKFTRNMQKFGLVHGETRLNELSSRIIEKWLHGQGWAPATIKSVRTDLQTFFGWCVKRGYCEQNPVSSVPVPLLDQRPPGILTVLTVRRLLEKCKECDPAMCGFFSLGIFAGIRPGEIIRMSKNMIHLKEKYAEVPSDKAKTRQRRIVALEPACVRWCRVGLELPPRNWRKRFDNIRAAAGVLEDWSHDCMRHSFGSYHLAAFGSADKTATQMGHASTDQLFRHYRELVRPLDAKEFWAI